MRQLERVILRARERAITRDPEATELVPEHVEARDLDGVSPASASNEIPTTTATEPPASAWQRMQATRSRVNEEEQEIIRRALTEANGLIAHAARSLGIARTTLASRLDVLGMRAPTSTKGDPTPES